MQRLTRLDRLLLWTLTPIWFVCVALHLDRQLAERPLAWVPLYVEPSAGPAGEPIVTGYWPETPPREQELRPGDRLVRAGDVSLAGVGFAELWARIYEAAGQGVEAPLTAVRDGRPVEATLTLRPVSYPWRTVPLSVALGLSALLAVLRGRGSVSARAYAMGAIAYSIQWSFFFGGAPWQTEAGLAVFLAAGALYQPLTLRAALLFPESVAVRSPRLHGACWVFALTSVGLASWIFGAPLSGRAGLQLLAISYGLWIVAFLFILARNYRRADRRGRRQLKWVTYGFYVGLGPALLGSAVFGARPDLRNVYELSMATTALIPIFLYVAFIRYNLYDINRLITNTIAFTLLGCVFLGLLLTLGVPAAGRLSTAIDVQQTTALWVIAVLVAAPMPWLARFVGPWVERTFFHEQFRLEQQLEALRREIDRYHGPGDLIEGLAKRLGEIVKVETLAVYARAGEGFALVQGHGPILPPAFERDAGLALLLADSRRAVDRARIDRWLRMPALDSGERAAIEGLAAHLIVPFFRHEALDGFFCLGERDSGDPWRRSEVSLLDSLAERVSLQLANYDEEHILAEQRALYEKVAGYAPGAVRDEITRGADLESAEREVTILFVDIRGYTAFSAHHDADEIFRMVNAYTNTVSSIVRDHGGSVVEFHGDGLLAVFGAPAELAHKERAAVAAGRAAFERIASDESLEGGISIGVGIATGPSYVGNIQAIDRKIWSVIGNTTNLASRLEGLTRTLDAAVVIDEATHARAGDAGAGFEARRDVRVKGRDEAFTVWVLPLSSED